MDKAVAWFAIAFVCLLFAVMLALAVTLLAWIMTDGGDE